MTNHLQNQQEAIAEALNELMAENDGHEKAKQAIDGAIEEWIVYYETEAKKWRDLRALLNGGIVL